MPRTPENPQRKNNSQKFGENPTFSFDPRVVARKAVNAKERRQLSRVSSMLKRYDVITAPEQNDILQDLRRGKKKPK